MTDEEKKAIEQFKNFVFTYQDVIEDEYSDYEEKECAKEYQEVSEKIINLIEKQSKEIEDNKKYIDLHYVPYEQYVSITNGIDKKWKDKIKAKIEEVLKQLERKMEEEYNKYGNSREYQDIIDAYNFLQSLLEKE